jgi:hypothetical protein
MSQILTFHPPEVVAFEHGFFASFPDAYFRLSENGNTPVVAFEMGDQKVTLPFSGIKREFKLPEFCADAVMLNIIVQALNFVNILRIGDPIPPEVLTGEASWDPGPNHLAAAERRLSTELVGWSLGQEVPRGDPVRLRQFVAQNVNETAVNEALGQLSGLFGFGADGVGRLTVTMNDISDELAYIMALRERCQSVSSVGQKLKHLGREFTHHASVMADLQPALRLIKAPIQEFGEKLSGVDNKMSEIVTLFGDFESTQGLLRSSRDDLHCRLEPWDGIANDWERVNVTALDPFSITHKLRDLYRFLASRFMPTDEWALVLSRDGDEDDGQVPVVTWFENGQSV